MKEIQNDSRHQDNPGGAVMMEKEKQSHKEGPVAKAIEKETSKLPSDLFLRGGLGLLAASVFLHSMKQKHPGFIVG